MTLVIAHRGAHESGPQNAPENSLDAFAAAIELGADAIEFDVRSTADGQLVAWHDLTLRGRRLRALTYPDACDALGRPLARLEAVLELAGGRIGLDIELKEDGDVERILQLAAACPPETTLVTSFLDGVVRQVKQLRPDLRAGLLLGIEHPAPWLRTRAAELFPVRRAAACGADLVAMHAALAGLGALARAHAAGLPALVWTVNGDRALRRCLRDARVLGVITDRPARALQLRRT